MNDAELVDLALSGDPDAFAAVYDTYADSIHDFCASLLRDWDEAADATEDSFVAAFEALEELADPGDLRSWLYAIAHRVVTARVPAGALPPSEDDEDLIWGPDEAGARLTMAELTTFVWQVTAGLDLEERVLVDLDIRQGLRGRDLARASGVAPGQVDRIADRVEAGWERSIGALIVARTGRRLCPDVADLVERWDGRLTPEFRQDVTAHVEECDECDSLRRSQPDPLALLEAIPLTSAPEELRDPILDAGDGEAAVRRGEVAVTPPVATAGWSFDRDGFPMLEAAATRGRQAAAAGTRAAAGRAGLEETAQWSMPASGPQLRTATTWAAGQQAQTGTTWPPGEGSGYDGAGGTADTTASSGAAPPPRGPGRPPGAAAYAPASQPVPPPPEGDRRGAIVGALAGVIVLILAGIFVAKQRGGSSTDTTGTTTLPSLATVNNSEPTSTIAPLSVPAGAGTTTTTVITSGQLVVTTSGGSTGGPTGGPQSIDFGVSSTSQSFKVTNSGQADVTFTAAATGAGLTVQPSTGTLIPGASQILTVTLNRSAAPQGFYSGSISLSSPNPTRTKTVTTTVAVTASIDSGPTISGNRANPMTIYVSNCAKLPKGGQTAAQVTATVAGPVPMTEVVLHWLPASGGSGGTSIMSGVGSSYAGELGPFPTAGNVGWYITAIDTASATATSQSQALSVSAC
ncbi:MAG: BACON domain-containing protein [Acidimicrobiales bacterium]